MFLQAIRCLLNLDQTSTMKCYYYLSRSCSRYTSSISLDKLYPPSDKREMKDLTAEEFSGHIPISEITRTFSCSGGPGGQNVNKVATKVDVRSQTLNQADALEKLRAAIRFAVE